MGNRRQEGTQHQKLQYVRFIIFLSNILNRLDAKSTKYSWREVIIVFAVNSGCDWEMLLLGWQLCSVSNFFFTAGCQNITRIACFRVSEMSSAMSKKKTLGCNLLHFKVNKWI